MTAERTRMTVAEIMKALELHTGRFPKRAVQEAIEQRDAITPELLRVLEEVAEAPTAFARRDDYMLHLYAMYLLAQFREKRAYRPLARIFSAPGEVPEQLAGDVVTESLGQIFGSVYDGDPVKALLSTFAEPASPKALPSRVKVGRNEPCPCGSRKKYKKCCGGS